MNHELIGLHIGPFHLTGFLYGDEVLETLRAVETATGQASIIRIVGRARLEEPVFSPRFRRAARAVASLSHPNIARVYDFGQIEGGHYVITEDVEGSRLDELLDGIRQGRSALSPDDIAFIVRQIAAALDAAHRRGILHGALTPQSVTVTRSGRAVVSDFGLSLLYAQEANREFSLPVPSQYIAPELAADFSPASPAADVYALGVIFYELLTGSPPFAPGSDVDEVLQALSDTAPDPRLLTPAIPEKIAGVVLKALSRDPEQRYASAMQFASAVEQACGIVLPASAPQTVSPEMPSDELSLPADPAGRLGTRAGQPAPRRRPALGRAGLILLIMGLLLAATALVLHMLGVINVSVLAAVLPGEDTPIPPAFSIAPSATAAPAIEQPATMAGTVTPYPTPTRPPSPTPLTEVSATPVPPVELATLAAGASAYRFADGMVMQFVPAGQFLMGTDDPARHINAHPQHPVMLGDYWIDRTEVTNAQYRRCLENGPCQPLISTTYFDVPGRASHPVVYVTHSAAVTYCLWIATQTGLPIGLPTEAQWEKAAAWDPVTETARLYPWGDEDPAPELVRFVRSFPGGTAPVGSYPEGASAYGVMDMAGNVWEWVADWFGLDTYQRTGVAVDPTGPESGAQRVMRGGGWANEEVLLISNVRTAAQPTAAGGELGFRCVLNTRRPPLESGVMLESLDALAELATQVEDARVLPDADADALREWTDALGQIRTLVEAGNESGLTLALADAADRLEAHRELGLLPSSLDWQIEAVLAWIGSSASSARP